MREDAAFQIAAELALDVVGNRVIVIAPVAPEREPGREVGLDGAVQGCVIPSVSRSIA